MPWPKGRPRPKKAAAPSPSPSTMENDVSTSITDLVADINAAAKPGADKPNAPVANDVPTGEITREQMLADIAERYSTTPEEVAKLLRVDQATGIHRPKADGDGPLDVPLPEGAQMYPVELTADYWAGKQISDQWPTPPEPGYGGDNRCKAGKTIRLPIDEAMRLIGEGKAKRADVMTPA